MKVVSTLIVICVVVAGGYYLINKERATSQQQIKIAPIRETREKNITSQLRGETEKKNNKTQSQSSPSIDPDLLKALEESEKRLKELEKAPKMKDIYAETHHVLSHDKSLRWLNDNKYGVGEAAGGYHITRKSPGYVIDISLQAHRGTSINGGILNRNGRITATLIYENGNLCIAIPK